jgi:hypothetical protein
MPDNSLSTPQKVEYIVVKNRPRKKIWIVIAIFILLAITYVVAIYLSQRDVARTYTDKPLEALGLKASLKAKWFDSKLHYQFILIPLPNQEERFLAVMQRDKASDFKFTIQLNDADGYELCTITPLLHRHLGLNGKPDSLEADQGTSTCMKNQFVNALKWSISGHYPAISDSLDGNPTTSGSETATTRLTGSNFITGNVETLDRGSFQVTKQAEFFTLAGWKPADGISINCSSKQCVLTDLRTDESVHAMLK